MDCALDLASILMAYFCSMETCANWIARCSNGGAESGIG